VKVLHKNIKDPKHKMRVLLKPNVQELILDFKNHLQRLGVLLLDFNWKKSPTHLFTWRMKVGQRWGFKSRINKSITTKKLRKKTLPILSTWEDGWGNKLQKSFNNNLHQFGHEVQHLNLYFLPLALEAKLHLLAFLSSK